MMAPTMTASAASVRLAGVYSPVLTPFDGQGRPAAGHYVRHCRWLLERNVGLAIFGTNSEATSLGLAERMTLLEALLDAGLDPRRMMPGTGTCNLPDTVQLTRHAVGAGCASVLMLPPF